MFVLIDPIAAKIRATVACLTKPNHVGRLGVALALCCALETNSLAQDLGFPSPAPETAARAHDQFVDRAKVVIETNACGREDDYLRIRAEMAAGNFEHEGEDFIHILTAKVAYIRAHSNFGASNFTPSQPCTAQIVRLRSAFENHELLVGQLKADASKFFPAGTLDPNGYKEEPLVDPDNDSSKSHFRATVSTNWLTFQVNDAVTKMKKTSRMGTPLPCTTDIVQALIDAGALFPGRVPPLVQEGEWDVNNRELVRLLYLSGSTQWGDGGILFPSTVDYMYRHLLAAKRGLSPDTIPVLFDCNEPAGDELGTPEDTADRDAWYNDVADFLGDALEWFGLTYLTYGLGPFGAIGLVGVSLLLAGTVDSPVNLFSHAEIYVRETENHRLNIETSRFLTNADMIARLNAEHYGLGELGTEQAEVRDWLIRRLQDIARNDFQEYNARPYTRYSLNSILNLYDFAKELRDPDNPDFQGDTELASAAGIVLDLSEAKFAATSNRGRRIVPFRRLSDQDGDEGRYLYESVAGADHEIARAMLLSGQTQLLNPHHGDRDAQGKEVPLGAYGYKLGVLAEMVNAATSDYRLPLPVLTAAIERREFEQTIRHSGVERVEQSPAFTISAGGIRTDSSITFLGIPGAGRGLDRGIAMPTVIIPTISGINRLPTQLNGSGSGSYMRDLFRFDGVGVHDDRLANTCVAPGFACGLNPRTSDAFVTDSTDGPAEDMVFFVSSIQSHLDVSGPHFYLAGRMVGIPSKQPVWGIMDIKEATPPPPIGDPKRPADDPAFRLFKEQRRAALRAVTLSDGRGVYTTDAGHRIEFGLTEDGGRLATIISIDGKPPPEWKTSGGLIEADGQGHATIKGAGEVVIDFSDPMHPSRITKPTP